MPSSSTATVRESRASAEGKLPCSSATSVAEDDDDEYSGTGAAAEPTVASAAASDVSSSAAQRRLDECRGVSVGSDPCRTPLRDDAQAGISREITGSGAETDLAANRGLASGEERAGRVACSCGDTDAAPSAFVAVGTAGNSPGTRVSVDTCDATASLALAADAEGADAEAADAMAIGRGAAAAGWGKLGLAGEAEAKSRVGSSSSRA